MRRIAGLLAFVTALLVAHFYANGAEAVTGGLDGSAASAFVKERLEKLAVQRRGLESTVAELDGAIDKIRKTAVDQEKVVTAFARIYRAVKLPVGASQGRDATLR